MQTENYISELTDILKHEVRSFNTIFDLLTIEEKSLVECDKELLYSVLERQEDVFSSIACLEKSRMEIIKKITEKTKENPDTYTIFRLSGLVDDPLKKELVETGHVLASLYDDINHKKMTNNMLIKQGIILLESDIRLILDIVNQNEQKDTVYTSRADANNTSASVCIDERM